MEESKLVHESVLCDEGGNLEKHHSLKDVCDIEPSLHEQLLAVPGAMDYIKKLQKLIKKYLKRIQKLKNKLKKIGLQDSATQTNNEDFIGDRIHIDHCNVEDNEPKSLVDDIKQAAETAMQNMGFVYEETSGLYYDYSTGYYYNAEYGLYYDDKSGSYLKYNSETQAYEFHSQVQVQSLETSRNTRLKKRKLKTKAKDKRHLGEDIVNSLENDIEEGECSGTNESSSDDESDSNSESSKQWPPCMRIVVESSENPNIKLGSLYIITCDGGTLGREGNHSILISDLSISKHHLKFFFDKESDSYKVIDLGSRNGTLLNGKRLSPSKQESEPVEITHGSKIQIGSTVLLCHVHVGTQTCGHCEPGLLSSKEPQNEQTLKPSGTYRNELKNLKKMYGVNYELDSKLAAGYIDRAQKRRKTVGSQNAHEKTQVASVNESITKENKGFKLLSKMGWKEGESLGKDGGGLLEPIQVDNNRGSTGLGCKETLHIESVASDKQNVWKITKERFDKLPDRNEAFED